jgi:Protein of unknown function (DUF2752)
MGMIRRAAMTDTAEHVHPYAQMMAPAGVPAGMVPVWVGSIPAENKFNQFMMRRWASSPRWFGPLAILVCFGGGVFYTLALNPTESGAFSSPTCIVKLTTGFDCPGCGGTRAFWYLLHGDIPAAARSHILAVFAAPYLVYLFIAWSGNTVFGWKIPYLRVTPKVLSFFLAFWGIFTVARNLPWPPFTWMYV